jgi:hypothetical protein
MTEIRDFLREQLARPHVGWSIGIFGALAEFHREESEEAECRELTVSTPLGAIRLEPVEGCRPVRYEPRSAKHAGRHFGVALCLPEAQARMQCRCALTELGEDREAINAKDGRALLFDLGLGTPYGMFCVRTVDEVQLARLRAGLGRSVLDPGNPLFEEIACMSPHRVFMSRLGRIEVFQRIAPKGGATPRGPHTHLLPKLARRRRMHSANAILPAGLVPCATFYPDLLGLDWPQWRG